MQNNARKVLQIKKVINGPHKNNAQKTTLLRTVIRNLIFKKNQISLSFLI